MTSSLDRTFPNQFSNLSSAALREQMNNVANDIEALQSGAAVESRVTVTTSSYTVTDSPTQRPTYVGVRPSSSAIALSLAGIPAGAQNVGRRIAIVDEAGNAAVHNINVTGGTALIGGDASPFVINTNGGSVSLVSDGTNWFVLG